jgi:hypothetical protein
VGLGLLGISVKGRWVQMALSPKSGASPDIPKYVQIDESYRATQKLHDKVLLLLFFIKPTLKNTAHLTAYQLAAVCDQNLQ